MHYIPVDYFFTNLAKGAAWALCPNNAPQVEAMLKRLKTFADDFLTQVT